jgi:hypothetical protein
MDIKIHVFGIPDALAIETEIAASLQAIQPRLHALAKCAKEE